MIKVSENSALWQYLPAEQRVLLGDGVFLVSDSDRHLNEDPTDYSYLVFPYAKLYEGFLKQLFRDTHIIREEDYWSDHFRLGKALSPTMSGRLGDRSAYRMIASRFGKGLAEDLWRTWKEGRNQVFHYFPHNYKALSKDQAKAIVSNIIDVMEKAVHITHVSAVSHVT